MNAPMVFVTINYYTGSGPSGGTPDASTTAILHQLLKETSSMSDSLTKLQEADTAEAQKIEAAVKVMADAGTTLKELAAKITGAGTNEAALKAIAEDLTSHATTLDTATKSLADAVSAQKPSGTPSAPAPEPVPEPDMPAPAKPV